jgi:hypothetical protein
MNKGSWLQRHPRTLAASYRVTAIFVRLLHPLIALIGYKRVSRWISPVERAAKNSMFGCDMCGQCVLHSTGMTCPMTCPKQLRNGACGGVGSDGSCEVEPEMRCVWVEAYERAHRLIEFGPEIIDIRPPVNHTLSGTSAWVNMLTGEDREAPSGWMELPHSPVVERKLYQH